MTQLTFDNQMDFDTRLSARQRSLRLIWVDVAAEVHSNLEDSYFLYSCLDVDRGGRFVLDLLVDRGGSSKC